MRQFSGNPVVAGQKIFSSSSTQAHDLGTLITDGYGRKFRYAKAGGTLLVVGNMLQAPAEIANHYGCAIAAASIGDTSLTVTPGATGGAANLYANGWAHIDTAGGSLTNGWAYPIAGHAAITSSTAFTLNLKEPLELALTTSAKVTLVPNPYSGVIQTPVTTLTGAAVGCCVYPIAANEYGWIQTGGPACVLVAGTPGPGLAVVVPGTSAGCVVVDGAASATPPVGVMMVTGVDGKTLPVYLTID